MNQISAQGGTSLSKNLDPLLIMCIYLEDGPRVLSLSNGSRLSLLPGCLENCN